MHKYSEFVLSLEKLALESYRSDNDRVLHAINGEAYSFLRSSISLDARRGSGAFFTETEFAKKIGKEIFERFGSRRVLDPACGAGDLLLGYAWHLPLFETLRKTIDEWSKLIFGFDIHREFIEATKLRLVLLARQRGGYVEELNISNNIFPFIEQRDALIDVDTIRSAEIIITNPPYNYTKSDHLCKWATGNITAAAKFIDHLTHASSPGCQIYAILPEVIRCGSRYQKFREMVSERVNTIKIDSLGQFDKWTDIDVFLAHYIKLEGAEEQRIEQEEPKSDTVSTYFNISVGPVVHYRDPNPNIKYPFAHAKNVPPWQEITSLDETRGFNGRLIECPCVVIRRTSRPGDLFRAVGTIVNTTDRIAVENHLIVASPKDGKIETCKNLLSNLKSEAANSSLNNRMRCRHLTVGAVKNIPWIIEK